LHEVRIVDVAAQGGRVLLTLLEPDRDDLVRAAWFVADSPGPGVVARLDGWCTDGSALLLFTDEHDKTYLLAPDGTSIGLRVSEVNA
jgi:hypothetical protein